MIGTCEDVNEPVGPIKGVKFLNCLRVSASWRWLVSLLTEGTLKISISPSIRV